MPDKQKSSKKDRHKSPSKLVRFPGNMLNEVIDSSEKHGMDATHLIVSGTRMALNELKKENPNLPPPL